MAIPKEGKGREETAVAKPLKRVWGMPEDGGIYGRPFLNAISIGNSSVPFLARPAFESDKADEPSRDEKMGTSQGLTRSAQAG